jgi:hypothetical protein
VTGLLDSPLIKQSFSYVAAAPTEGGDAGFTRDGTHAELIAVPAASLCRKPDTLSFNEAASVGVNYMAAWRSASMWRRAFCSGVSGMLFDRLPRPILGNISPIQGFQPARTPLPP